LHFDHDNTASVRVLRPTPGKSQFRKTEKSRPSPSIGLVKLISGTGLVLAAAAWIFGG